MNHLDCVICDRAMVAYIKRFADKFAIPLCEDCIRPLEVIQLTWDKRQGFYYAQR